MSSPLRRRLPTWLWLLAAVSVALALVVAGLGVAGSPHADAVGLLLSGPPPVVAGAVILWLGLTARPHQPFRLLLGASALLWGLCQLSLGVRAAGAGFDVTGLAVPDPADVLAAFAAPLALAGLAVLPRRSSRPLDRLRTVLDALLISSAGTMLVWQVFFRESFGGNLGTFDLTIALFVVMDLTILAIFVATAVRELDPGVVLASVGIVLQVGSDLVSLATSDTGGSDRPWSGSAVTCVAWSLIGLGFAVVRPSRAGSRRTYRPVDETRRLVGTATVSLALVGTLMVALLGPDNADVTLAEQQVTILLALVFLVVLWCRELIRARQSQALLEQLSEQALTDPLTGLSNRRALTDSLEAACGHDVGLLTFDLDGFKDVNRLLGHTTGDALLVGVGEGMRQVLLDRSARAFRLGGDEFAVLAHATRDDCMALAEEVLRAVRTLGSEVPGVGRVSLSASIGVCHLDAAETERTDGDGRVSMMELSGEAMRESKASGRGRVTLYTADTAARARRRSAIERRLREVVEHGGIDVQFQPVMDIATGTVVGVEGLARWTDPEVGTVPPLEFIGIAEDTGLMPGLGLRILEEGLRGFVASGAPARGATMGMNFSTLQLRMPGFASVVIDMLHDSGLRPEQLVAEVTESVMLDDCDPATDAVYQLAAAGMPVALDDFGTGYSSLAYLHRLPAAILKIDRTMTLSMDTDRGMAIARSIVQMGQTLGMDIVAEGVETPTQAGYIRELGIPYVQGWLYSRALPADALRDFVEAHGTRHEHVLRQAASAATVAQPSVTSTATS